MCGSHVPDTCPHYLLLLCPCCDLPFGWLLRLLGLDRCLEKNAEASSPTLSRRPRLGSCIRCHRGQAAGGATLTCLLVAEGEVGLVGRFPALVCDRVDC